MILLVSLPDIWHNLTAYVTDADRWLDWSIALLRIVLIYMAAKVLIRLLNKTIAHIAEEKDRFKFNPRRTTTIVVLVGNIVKYVINFVMVLLILDELGLPLGPMLAGAGVIGLAIGFGAQSLVKDVITGFFIIFEDQFAVGDVVQTRSYKGVVEEIGLRVTRIRSWTGEVHIIPNGAIVEVTNYSLHDAVAVIDVTVANAVDVDQATALIEATVARLHPTTDDIVQAPEVMGVQTFNTAQFVIRVCCRCKPNTQHGIARLLNAEIKKSLDGSGIDVPQTRTATYHRNDKAE